MVSRYRPKYSGNIDSLNLATRRFFACHPLACELPAPTPDAADRAPPARDPAQSFCELDTQVCCRSDHFSVDFTSYIVFEAEALAKIAAAIGRHDRAAYWTELAANTSAAMHALMWDDASGFFYDRKRDGSGLKPVRSVAGFYPLNAPGMPRDRAASLVALLKSAEFSTAVPLPTVSTSTPDFSTDLDRGPMWAMQNFYVIRGLRRAGYGAEADALKAASLRVVRRYYERYGAVFEYYDSLDATDPRQTLRKPAKADAGACRAGVAGPAGHCGPGGIREYTFTAALALLWLRGGE